MSQADHASAQAVASQNSAPCSEPAASGGFEAFYRDSYRAVVKAAMNAGATIQEAEDAAGETFEAMLKRWPIDGTPLRYARKAVISNFIKDKTRGTDRVARRLIDRGHVMRDHQDDPRLSELENRESVIRILNQLSPSQREVMERIADGLTYEEIAEELGRSGQVVRRRLCDARARLIEILNPDSGTAGQSRPATTRHTPEEAR